MGKFLKKTTMYYDVLQYVFVVTYLAILFIPVRIPAMCYILLPVINIVGFMLYKDYVKSFDWSFFVLRIGLIIFSVTVPFYLLKVLSEHIKKEMPFAIGAVFGMVFAASALYLFCSDNEKKKEKILNINIRGLLEEPETEENDYDVVICRDKDTKKDVLLKADDRYMHMIIIGPTGCGKTSLMLTPMVLQDIKKGHGVIIIEPKGDFAETAYAIGKLYDKNILYFNPVDPDCPYFNPLYGKEDEVIETLTTTFTMLAPDSITYFKDISDNLIRRSVMVLKRIEEAYRNPATGISTRPALMIGLSDILHNTENRGRDMMNDLLAIPCISASEEKQNKDTVDWFLNEYYSDRSKVYENSSGIRTQVSKLIQNKYVRRVLNPENGISDIDFDKILSSDVSVAISTAQGALRELGSYLGYFIIFSLQSAIFRRPGNEFTRIPKFLYIDEFQKYANPGMSDLLTQGRSYRVPAILSTQGMEQITMGSGKDGKAFLKVVQANARNVIAFPGISPDDARFFSLSFGDEKRIQERYGESKQKFSLGYGFRNINYPTESTQYTEVTEAKFSESELIFKPFSEITYKILKNKTVQQGKEGIVSWIPKEIYEKLEKIVSDYNECQRVKREQIEMMEMEERRKIYSDFQKEVNSGKTTLGDLNGRRKNSTYIRTEDNRTFEGALNSGKRVFEEPKKNNSSPAGSDIEYGSVIGAADSQKKEMDNTKIRPSVSGNVRKDEVHLKTSYIIPDEE